MGTLLLTVEAEGERLHAAREKPGFEWRERGPGGVLMKAEFLRELRVARHHGARGHIAMPVEKLRR